MSNSHYDKSYGPGPHYTQDYGQPQYSQSAYTQQPPVPESVPYSPKFDQGYAHRQGLAPSSGAHSIYRDRMGFLKSKWPAAFMGETTLQAIICLAFESFVVPCLSAAASLPLPFDLGLLTSSDTSSLASK